MPALHALGDGHFVLTFQQRYRTHLPQVQPNWIVVLVQHPWCEVQVALFGDGRFITPFRYWGFRDDRVYRGASSLCGGKVVVQSDPDSLERGEHVADLVC